MNKTTINLVYNSRTTRLPAVPQDFDDLCLMIHTIYNNQLQGTFELAYKDNDDNVFVIENDESLNAALNYIEQQSLQQFNLYMLEFNEEELDTVSEQSEDDDLVNYNTEKDDETNRDIEYIDQLEQQQKYLIDQRAQLQREINQLKEQQKSLDNQSTQTSQNTSDFENQFQKCLSKTLNQTKLNSQNIQLPCSKCSEIPQLQSSCKKCSGTGIVQPKQKYVNLFEQLFEQKLASFKIQQRPQSQNVQYFIHNDSQCSNCQVSPIIGERYQSKEFPEFNVCKNCVPEVEHLHNLSKVNTTSFQCQAQQNLSHRAQLRRKLVRMHEHIRLLSKFNEAYQNKKEKNFIQKQARQTRFYSAKLLTQPRSVQTVEVGKVYNNFAKLKNNGETRWANYSQLICISGYMKGSTVDMPTLEKDDWTTVVIDCRAPEKAGRYLTVWQMSYFNYDTNQTKFFGPKLAFDTNVVVPVEEKIRKKTQSKKKTVKINENKNEYECSQKVSQKVLNNALLMNDLFKENVGKYVKFIEDQDLNESNADIIVDKYIQIMGHE